MTTTMNATGAKRARTGKEFIEIGDGDFVRASAIKRVTRRRSPAGEIYYELQIDGASVCYPAEAVVELLKWLNEAR